MCAVCVNYRASSYKPVQLQATSGTPHNIQDKADDNTVMLFGKFDCNIDCMNCMGSNNLVPNQWQSVQKQLWRISPCYRNPNSCFIVYSQRVIKKENIACRF